METKTRTSSTETSFIKCLSSLSVFKLFLSATEGGRLRLLHYLSATIQFRIRCSGPKCLPNSAAFENILAKRRRFENAWQKTRQKKRTGTNFRNFSPEKLSLTSVCTLYSPLLSIRVFISMIKKHQSIPALTLAYVAFATLCFFIECKEVFVCIVLSHIRCAPSCSYISFVLAWPRVISYYVSVNFWVHFLRFVCVHSFNFVCQKIRTSLPTPFSASCNALW